MLERLKNAVAHGKLTPSLQIASQSRLDCSDAAGLVSSMSILESVWIRRRTCAAEQGRTVYTKVVECLGDLDLGLKVEVGVGKLLAFSQCALYTEY